MSVSGFHPAQDPHNPLKILDNPAIPVMLTRLMARVDLTIGAYLDADAALRRSAAALFAAPGPNVAPRPKTTMSLDAVPRPPWGAPTWLKPLQKSLENPSPSLARLFFATFDRWLTHAPDAERLRLLETKLALPRAATALLAAILTLETPTAPAALASALADESTEARRHLLSLMLPGGQLVDHSVVQNASPLSPIVPHPSLYATSLATSGWMTIVDTLKVAAAPPPASCVPPAPTAGDEDRDEETELICSILDAVAMADLAAHSGGAPLDGLDEALTSVTALRARIPFGSLGPRALALLESVPRALVALALHLPDPRAVAGCLAAIDTHAGGARANDLRIVALTVAAAAVGEHEAADAPRALALAGLGRAFAARHQITDLELIFCGLQAEAEVDAQGATTTWREVKRGAVGQIHLALLAARADSKLLPAFGLFAPEDSAK